MAKSAVLVARAKPSPRKEDWIRADDQDRTGDLSLAMSIFNDEAAQRQSPIAELQTSKPASA